MIRNLLIITFVGLGLAVVGIGGAMAVGGADLSRGDWTWVITEDETGDSSFRIERGAAAPDVVRKLEWAGGEALAIDIPGEIAYTQGSQPAITVSGPQTIVDRVRLIDGRLTLEPSTKGERAYVRWSRSGIRGWSETDALRVAITAPRVRAFDVTGEAELTVRHYDQPTLKLVLSDEAYVEVQGKTDTVDMDLSGSSRAELESLMVTDANIRASGYGDVEVGPTGVATVDVAGDADVTLTRQPGQLRQTISGDAEVTQH